MTSDYVYCLKQAILDSPDIIYYCLVNPKDFNEQIMPLMKNACTINYAAKNFNNVFRIHTAQIIKNEKINPGEFLTLTELNQ